MKQSISFSQRGYINSGVSKAMHFFLLAQFVLVGLGGLSGAHAREISNLQARSVPILAPANPAVSDSITDKQILQTRFNFGVNFGGVFVREQWLFPSMMPAGANTELEAVTIAANSNRNQAKTDLERHWNSYALAQDWDWLKLNNINSIRLPIGYWNVDAGSFTQGTRFASFNDIYANSWQIIKSKFIEPAAERGIAVIIDLHGVPGGANPNAHNGEEIGKEDFWTNPQYQDIAINALEFIAKDLKDYNNIGGIEVINEALFSNDATAQKSFYRSALQAIRKHDKDVPVIISDGWWPEQWVQWIQDGQGDNFNAGLVVDHHIYRLFANADTSKSAQQIINDLDTDVLTNLRNNANGVDFMVGEWSCVLASESWSRSGGNTKNLVAQYGSKQEKLIEQRAAGGSFFWTFKFESGNGGEWDIHQQLGSSFNAPSISVPSDLQLYSKLQLLLSLTQLVLYQEGFTAAWNDAIVYAKKGSLMGRKQAVKMARKQQRISTKGNPGPMNDWDTGYTDGLEALEKVVRGN